MSIDVLNETEFALDELELVACARYVMAEMKVHPQADLCLRLVDEDVRVARGAVDPADHEALPRVGGRRHVVALLRRDPAVDAGPDVDDAVGLEVVELLDVVEADLLALDLLHRAEAGENAAPGAALGDQPRGAFHHAVERVEDHADTLRTSSGDPAAPWVGGGRVPSR